MKAQRARREGDPRRPALHPHQRDGRPDVADPGRDRHRLPRRPDPPRARERARTSATTCVHYTNAADDHRPRTSATPRTSTGCSRASTPRRAPTTPVVALRGRRARPAGRQPEHATQSFTEHTGGRHDAGRRRATRRCRTRAASSRSCAGTSRATRRRWSSEVCGIPRGHVPARSPRRADAQLGAATARRVLLRGRLDAAHDRRADHPRGGDPATAARQHRPAGRRDPGAARARVDPGSTDIPTLYDLLPGYLHMPRARGARDALGLHARRAAPTGWWATSTATSSRCSRRGSATPPRGERLRLRLAAADLGDHSHIADDAARCRRRGSRACSRWARTRPSAARTRACSAGRWRKLEWLVVRDLYETETGAVLEDSPEVGPASCARRTSRPRSSSCRPRRTPRRTARSRTRSACSSGTTRRSTPPGDARSRGVVHATTSAKRVKRALRGPTASATGRSAISPGTTRRARARTREPDAEAVLREINGYDGGDWQPVAGFAELADDGSTACGCWIYSRRVPPTASIRRAGASPATPTRRTAGSAEWGWAWPANRRMLYNRASADPDGQPWSERKRYVWWDAERGRVDGLRRAGLPGRQAARLPRRRRRATGMDAISGDDPFIMMADGRGWLFAPSGCSTARCRRTTSRSSRRSRTRCTRRSARNPAPLLARAPDNPLPRPGSALPGTSLTTYRLTEHHTAGAMSRSLPWLAELQPEMFCEIEPELARERGIEDGGWMTSGPSAARSRRARW